MDRPAAALAKSDVLMSLAKSDVLMSCRLGMKHNYLFS